MCSVGVVTVNSHKKQREYQNFTFVLFQVLFILMSLVTLGYMFSKEVKLDQPLCSSRLGSSPQSGFQLGIWEKNLVFQSFRPHFSPY